LVCPFVLEFLERRLWVPKRQPSFSLLSCKRKNYFFAVMDSKEVQAYFANILKQDKAASASVASIETLYECLKRSNATTLIGLSNELKKAVEAMLDTDCSYITISSASELFLRFISLASLDQPHQIFSDCLNVLLLRGKTFLHRVADSRYKIACLSRPFIRNGSRILTHANSQVLLNALVLAKSEGKTFDVYVTQSSPDHSGELFKSSLEKHNIPCTVILDSAVGYIMESVDFVLVGAEGVVEPGGIINKIGTLTIAMCAKAMNKPFYVLAESVKFVRAYPINQEGMPLRFKYRNSLLKSGKDLRKENPRIDYTPPSYINLLFTDLGILTPAAVSDELIKLYM
ncbi:initiation factor, subunit 2 family protein, partial [Trichuris suis]